MTPPSYQELYRAQYHNAQQESRDLAPSTVAQPPLSHSTSSQSGQYSYFHTAAKRNGCKSYKFHRSIRNYATPKDAKLQYKERRENSDWNHIFSPSIINIQCNRAAIRELLDCPCTICRCFNVDLTGDDQILSDVERDLEVRFSISVLAYMGAGFSIRELHRCGIGNSGFSLATRLGSFSLIETLFIPLQKEPKIPEYLDHGSDRPIRQMAEHFTTFYEEMRMLLRSPKLEVNMSTTELQGFNLPFLNESSLYLDESLFPHISTIDIHPDYRGTSIPTGKLVRKRLQRASGTMNESAGDEKNILKFIAGLDRKNIIKLCCWFSYENTINLIFPKYPGTLEDVLLERWSPGRRSQLSSKFRGSKLNHWLWEEAVDIFEALEYIHNPGTFNGEKVIMAHFDLKPANFLVDEEGHLVITDFGIARIKGLSTGNTTGLLGIVGTSNYAPPEANRSSKQSLNRAYDIWSMGCVLLEIMVFVLYDKGSRNNGSDIVQFKTERLKEGTRREVHADESFWKEGLGRHGPSLKDCVDNHMGRLERIDDVYLKRAAKEVRNHMLHPTANNRHTAKECHDQLKDDLPTTHRGLNFSGDQIVPVGEHTLFPIHQMSIFFDSKDPERLSHPSVDCQLRCFLIRSSNPGKNKWRVVMSYESHQKEKEQSDCGYLAEEEFVPTSSYINPRIRGTPFQFRLTSIHPQITFKFKEEMDYFRVQTAFTRQQVRLSGQGSSSIPIKRCWFKRASLNPLTTRLKVSGSVQIWDQLSEEEYRASMIPDHRRHSYSGSASGSGSGSSLTGYGGHGFSSPSRVNTTATVASKQDTAPKRSIKTNPTRIAIFLCSDPAVGQKVTLITLNEAYQERSPGEHIYKDKNIPEAERGNFEACVTLNTLPGHSSFKAGFFEDIIKTDDAGSPIHISPGIPLDPVTLHNKEQEAQVQLKWLEIEFNTKADRERFLGRLNQGRQGPYDSRVP